MPPSEGEMLDDHDIGPQSRSQFFEHRDASGLALWFNRLASFIQQRAEIGALGSDRRQLHEGEGLALHRA